jgi:2-C-methyl-D-erythritol 4-phosphate cytidylyltransferase
MKLFDKKTTAPKKDVKNSVTVILAAAGSGTRLGGVSKPLLRLCGKYAIEYSIMAFSSLDEVTRIIISTREDDIPAYEKLIRDGNYTKVAGIVAGGATRQESVSKAFRYSFSRVKTDFVAIHDAARPLITAEEISSAFADARKYGTAICASLCPDTVKRAGKGGFVNEDIDREGLYLIGTPQVFSADIYMTALAVCERDGYACTDDSSLAEYAGFKLKLSQTSRSNIKITYPGDADLAELILSSRNKD